MCKQKEYQFIFGADMPTIIVKSYTKYFATKKALKQFKITSDLIDIKSDSTLSEERLRVTLFHDLIRTIVIKKS